jgi:hypothetical protein
MFGYASKTSIAGEFTPLRQLLLATVRNLDIDRSKTLATKVVFRFHEPEALADFCASKELG